MHTIYVDKLKSFRAKRKKLWQSELILQTDFAENYYIEYQNEAMQTHWNTEQGTSVIIYTAVIYYRQVTGEEVQVYVVFDATEHFSFIEILPDFNAKHGIEIGPIILWTDGATAQFKNRYSTVTSSFTNPGT